MEFHAANLALIHACIHLRLPKDDHQKGGIHTHLQAECSSSTIAGNVSLQFRNMAHAVVACLLHYNQRSQILSSYLAFVFKGFFRGVLILLMGVLVQRK